MSGVHRMSKPISIGAVITATVASFAVATLSPASAAKKNSPPDSLLIVTANLEEAWDYSDVQHRWDMDKFVARLLRGSKFLPDVLAVQEVRKSSVKYVARKLSRKSGQPYRVVVMPPSNPFQRYKGRAGARETSIVANVATIKVLHDGGMMPTAAKPAHVIEPHDPVFFQSYALLKKRSSGERFAVMSVHLYPRGYLANNDLDKYYRKKWANAMHKKLVNKYGSRKNVRYVMAGDFNQSSCLRGHWSKCYQPSPFWKSLIGRGYDDTSDDKGQVDLIMSKGKAGALHSMDIGFKKIPRAKRYSDHPFRWSVLGPDRYAPTSPKPVTVDLRRRDFGSRPPVIDFKWDRSEDRGGVGVAGYRFERKVDDGDWERLSPSGRFGHQDFDIEWGKRVQYRVRAFDKNRNSTGFVKRSVDVEKENVSKV